MNRRYAGIIIKTGRKPEIELRFIVVAQQYSICILFNKLYAFVRLGAVINQIAETNELIGLKLIDFREAYIKRLQKLEEQLKSIGE